MAFFNDIQPRTSLRETVAAFFSNLSSSIDLAASSKARMRQIEMLSALSDADLAARGLRREDIARYVLRDVLYM